MSDEILRALAPGQPRERTRAAEPGRPERVIGLVAAAIDASARWPSGSRPAERS
jgi:hypothetical protein